MIGAGCPMLRKHSDDEMVPGFQTDEISGLKANCITVNEIIDPRLLKNRRDR